MRSCGGAPVRVFRSLAPVLVLSVVLVVAAAVGAQSPSSTPAAAPASSAPGEGPVLLAVVDVKPELWDEYVALQKAEAIPALQKAGVESRSAWRTATLGPAYSVAYLYPLKSFAVLDGDPPMRLALGADGEKAIDARLRGMLTASRTCAMRRRADLSFGSDAADPKLGVLAHVYTMPGKQAEYEGVLKSEWMPGLKSAGVPLYASYEVVMGGEVGEYYTFVPIENLTALDRGHPILRSVGADAYEAMLAKFATSIRTIERTVIRRDDALSFTAKKPPISQ